MAIPTWIKAIREKIGHDLLLVPTVAGLIQNEAGAFLLQLRSDNGRWVMSGGMLDPGENPATGIVREVYEETGLQVMPERIVGVYGGEDYYVNYPNGDRVSMVSITFKCRVIGGQLQVDNDETQDLRYFAYDDLPETLDYRHRERIEHYLSSDTPYFSPSVFTF